MPTPMEDEEVAPQFVPPPRARASRARVASTPVPTIGAAAGAAAILDRPDVIPVPKAKAKAKARGRAASVERVPVSKRKASSTSIQAASLEPTPVLRPRAKSASRSLGPATPEDLPDVIPQVKATRSRKKPNNMTPADIAAAIGTDVKPAPAKATSKPPVAKRVPSAPPQGNRKPVVRKVSIAPSAKAAASMPGVKARKPPRNKKPLVAEIERLKA